MKKPTFILALILLIFFPSCTKSESISTVPDEFTADIVISVNETDCCAIYEKRVDCDRLVFSTPESLCGIELILKDGITTAKVGNISFESETLSAAFDFLPVTKSEEKTVGTRKYKITVKERF